MAEVRIHHADRVGQRRMEAGHHRGAETEFARPVYHLHASRLRELVGNLSGAIRRVVVHDDELEIEAGLGGGGEEGLGQLGQPVALVVGGHDHAEVRPPG
jgi:hypothetical protein